MENLFGRKTLYISVDHIDRSNIIEVIAKLNGDYSFNAEQIKYLYEYYKGKQPILHRVKEINDNILNTVVENRYREIVNFHTQYLAGDPIKYSANTQDCADEVDILNDFCRLQGKETLDYNLIKWYNICGTAYRMILPKKTVVEEGESPFFIDTLDPQKTAVVYTSKIPHEPKLCWYVTTDTDGVQTYSVYVKNDDGNLFFEIQNNQIIKEEPYPLSELPIIEYPYGEDRLSCAESVIGLCDAINNLDSNRIDGVEQLIQALLVLTNCKLPDDETTSSLKKKGVIELVSTDGNKATVAQLTTNLDQSNTQTLKEDLLNAIRTIACLPNTSEQTTGGDNGLAVVYRNGWEAAYESALGDQKNIDRSEYRAIKLMLEICDAVGKLSLPIRYINIDYTRQHYENMATKSQVLISMLNNDKIAPPVAYEVCGLFYDPNKKWLEGEKWYREHNTEETVTISEGDSTETKTETV